VRLLLIDNFDSFVYNLAQAFGALGAEPVVVRSDASLEELQALQPDAVVISPGPGAPAEAGVSLEAVRVFGPRVPLLGVCLGHQCIGAAFGGRIERAPVGPVHGKTSTITHDGRGVFEGLLVIAEGAGWPTELDVTARSEDGIVMGVAHRGLPVEGVQFHPESVLCPQGPRLLENFLHRAQKRSGAAISPARAARTA
jgi:para-aminobenzoate synthetase component II